MGRRRRRQWFRRRIRSASVLRHWRSPAATRRSPWGRRGPPTKRPVHCHSGSSFTSSRPIGTGEGCERKLQIGARSSRDGDDVTVGLIGVVGGHLLLYRRRSTVPLHRMGSRGLVSGFISISAPSHKRPCRPHLLPVKVWRLATPAAWPTTRLAADCGRPSRPGTLLSRRSHEPVLA